LSSALEGLVERPKDAEQRALFEDGRADSGGNSPPAVPRKAGRPAGSQNRTTRELREFYLGRFHDPLAGAIGWSLTGDLVHDVSRAIALAQLLKCKTFEALDFMRRSGEGAMPYLHARAVDLKIDGKVVQAHIGLGAPPAPGADTSGGMAILRRMFELAAGDQAPVIEAEAAEIENQGNSDG
jgi:hypothetical protein